MKSGKNQLVERADQEGKLLCKSQSDQCATRSSHLHSASPTSDINPSYVALFFLVDIMYSQAGNKRDHSFKLYNAIRFSERFDHSSETIIICPII